MFEKLVEFRYSSASVNTEIFRLYLEGEGSDTITRISEEDGYLNYTACWQNK